MIRAETYRFGNVTGLRTRFLPKSRMGQGIVGIAPWVNIVLLIIFFILLDKKFVLQPGYVVDLPRGVFSGGSRSELAVVVRSVSQAGGSGLRKEIIYFNDQRFLANDDQQMKNFQSALAGSPVKDKNSGLIVFADSHVNIETLMTLFNMASEVGIRKVNVASRTALEAGGGGK
jgi:biopolymer transport protein ExbD